MSGRKDRGDDTDPDDVLGQLAWLDPQDTTFGVRVLDCRPVAWGLVSTTKDRSVADRFNRLRVSNGEGLRGKLPDDGIPVPGVLRYPHNSQLVPDGCAFRSECMEDKWDAFLQQGLLYLCRSWTGDLVYRARMDFGAEAVILDMLAGRQACEGDPQLALRQVDYLLRSHLLGLPVAHPVPASVGDDPADIAIYSFSTYGRRGLFASFEDTTKAQPWFFDADVQNKDQ